MTTIIPFNKKIVHPDARWSANFDDYANYAAWSAEVAADPSASGPYVTGSPTPVIDLTYPFNDGITSRKSLWTANNQYIFAQWSDNVGPPYDTFQSVWMRVWVYFDPDAAANFDGTYYSAFPYMEGESAATLDYWFSPASNSFGNPLADSYGVDADLFGEPIRYSSMPYATLAGIWVPVILFAELINDGTAGAWGHKRQRMWNPDGTKAIDFTTLVPNDIAAIAHNYASFEFAMQFYGAAVPPIVAYSQFEFIPGETNPAPYCGLEDFGPCGQWGGVTEYTHLIKGGTIRTTVGLGGQPKGGYKKWRSLLGQRKPYPKLPIDRPAEPPVPDEIFILTLTETTTIAAAAFTDTAILLPATSTILSVDVVVTVAIPGPTTGFAVGDAGDANRYQAANVGTTVGSNDPGTRSYGYFNTAATPVRLGMIGGSPGANTGRVRVTISYLG